MSLFNIRVKDTQTKRTSDLRNHMTFYWNDLELAPVFMRRLWKCVCGNRKGLVFSKFSSDSLFLFSFLWQGHVVMGNNAISPYQQVIEKTKSLSFRSQMLAMNIEKKQSNANRNEVKAPEHLSFFYMISTLFVLSPSCTNDLFRRMSSGSQPRTVFTRRKPVRASLTERALSSCLFSSKA